MAGFHRIRGRDRRLQPAARPGIHQLAIFCAWRVRGRLGALAGGAAFILPGLILILALAALFLAGSPPLWVKGAGAGAGAAVGAVAVGRGDRPAVAAMMAGRPGRSSGSPPVNRISVMPRLVTAMRMRRVTSSSVSRSGRGSQSRPSAGMQ